MNLSCDLFFLKELLFNGKVAKYENFTSDILCINILKTNNDTSVHRNLLVNYYLKEIKIIANDCCTFYKEELETLQHAFF